MTQASGSDSMRYSATFWVRPPDSRLRPGFRSKALRIPLRGAPSAGVPAAKVRRVDQRHSGRRALVTGGATGIGRSTAKRLAAEGAAVVVNYVGPSTDADSAVAEIEGDGGRAIAIGADV